LPAAPTADPDSPGYALARVGRRALVLGVLSTVLFATLAAFDVGGAAAVWTAAHLTLAAIFGLVAVVAGWREADGRARMVRGLIGRGFMLWTASQLARDMGLMTGTDGWMTLADLLFIGTTGMAFAAYHAALHGRLGRTQEGIVYLDAALVVAASTATLTIIFGAQAVSEPVLLSLFIHGLVFVSILGASLILDLATRVERRPAGAYALLAGLAVLAVGFIGSASGGATEPYAWFFPALTSAGGLIIAYGSAGWNERVDPDPRYAAAAHRLRELLPLGAVASAPLLFLGSRLLPAGLGQGLVGLIIDISIAALLMMAVVRQSLTVRERERGLEELSAARAADERRVQQIAGMEAVGRLLASTGPTPESLEQVAALLGERFGYESVAIYRTDGEQLTLGASRNHMNPFLSLDGTKGIMGRVMRTHRAELVPDVSLESEYVCGDPAVRSEIAVPLLAGERLLGVLDIESTTADLLDETDLRVVIAVADQLASAMELGLERNFTNAILETVGALVIVVDAHGKVIRRNAACEEVSGYTSAELAAHRSLDFLVPPEDMERVRAAIACLSPGNPSVSLENDWLCKDGARRHIAWTNTAVMGEGGTIKHTIATGVDITHRKRLEEQLAHQALHDVLTGLPNRALFLDRVQRALIDDRQPTNVALLFLDLDDFKQVNDTYGHVVGDRVLTELSARLAASIRPSDTAARMGGDEFAVLLEGAGDAATTQEIASRISLSLAEPIIVDSHEIVVRVSIGIAPAEAGSEDAVALLGRADIAMYWAKSEGKGRAEHFVPRMQRLRSERLEAEARLERAVREQQFILLYQPIIDLASGGLIGLEALLRWKDPERGLLSPAHVIPLAEETGLIIPIGRWVLQEACREARRWRRPDGHQPWISVNLSARQFQEATLVSDVQEALSAGGLRPSDLVLEITESSLMQDSEATIDRLDRLKRLGVRLAVDDFGTGYSSLDYLRRFPVDILKIDRSFVTGVDGSVKESTLCRAIVALGQSLGLQTLAEGIETTGQLGALRTLGCELGQGFLFARPLEADAVTSFAAPAARGASATRDGMRVRRGSPIVRAPLDLVAADRRLDREAGPLAREQGLQAPLSRAREAVTQFTVAEPSRHDPVAKQLG
jgi:diguanylate cyclase (GGDEF)-like protein/PAS domain S-box-containing protein